MNKAPWQELKSYWMQGDGPEADVVVSVRIRLARNLEGTPFPTVASPEQRQKIITTMKAFIPQIEQKAFGRFKLLELDQLSTLERQLLVAKHLISKELAEDGKRGVLLNDREDISIMINEEDHLRIQTIFSGLQLMRAWELASLVDDALEAELDYAFSKDLGYLTACPTNVGTGIRVSVMLHLPGLTMVDQLKRIIAEMTQLGLAVRGLYGEGTEGMGDMYQISNQVTLGRTEEEIIENIYGVTRQIIEQERHTREVLFKDAKTQIEDRINRAFGILRYARLLSTEEAFRLLSDLRLGVTGEIIKGPSLKVLNELLVMIQPVFINLEQGRDLTAKERDYYRAAIVRDKLA